MNSFVKISWGFLGAAGIIAVIGFGGELGFFKSIFVIGLSIYLLFIWHHKNTIFKVPIFKFT